MQELIELGVRQGTLFCLANNVRGCDELVDLVKNGRIGDAREKKVGASDLFVMLTQDCSIADKGPYVELAQLNKTKKQDEHKVQNLMLGKDYKKLIVKVGDHYYEVLETLITKLRKKDFYDSISGGIFQIISVFSSHQKKIILDWRLLAYYREPFPDKFNQIFFEYLRQSSYWFVNYLIGKRDFIHSVRVYVSPEDDENADDYTFLLSALLTVNGEEHAEEISGNIQNMLHELNAFEGVTSLQLKDLDEDTIELPEHAVMAFTITLDEFTFANAYVMREFNFQYLCY